MAIKIILKEMFTFDLAVQVGEIELHLLTDIQSIHFNSYAQTE